MKAAALEAAARALTLGALVEVPQLHQARLAVELTGLWPGRCSCHGVRQRDLALVRRDGLLQLRCLDDGGRYVPAGFPLYLPAPRLEALRAHAPEGAAALALAAAAVATFRLGGRLALDEDADGIRDARPLIGSLLEMQTMRGLDQTFCFCSEGWGRSRLRLRWTPAGDIEAFCAFCSPAQTPGLRSILSW